MSNWLEHWDRRYTDRVQLLVEILPMLAQEPRFALIGLPHSADLPAVRRKLQNLAQRTDVKRAADRNLLEETLARIVAAR